MNFKKRASQSIALALVGVTIATPMLNTVSAMEKDLVTKDNEVAMINSVDNTDCDLEIGESVEISDNELIPLLLEEGFSKEDLISAGFYSKYQNGVNKVVKVSSGYNVYLSKSTLELAKKGGVSAISRVLATLLATSVTHLISPLIYQILIRAVPTVKGGMIFKMRIKKVYMGQYEGWVEMWVVDSYSYQ